MRTREPADWGRDLAAARPVEQRVRAALESHPEVSHLSDFTGAQTRQTVRHPRHTGTVLQHV